MRLMIKIQTDKIPGNGYHLGYKQFWGTALVSKAVAKHQLQDSLPEEAPQKIQSRVK